MTHRIQIYIQCLLFIFSVFIFPAAAGQNGLTALSAADRAALKQAAKDRTAGILVTDDQGGVLFSQNPDTPGVPASILKILTALAALEHLGTNFRFATRVAHDPETHTLYIKGFGDPLFVSEVIEKMCGQVQKKTGIQRIDRIILDPSWFDDKIQIPGTGRSLNPYDATTGALCANFNTVYFKQNAEDGTWVSSEPQTPLLEIFHDDIRRTGLTRGRILIRKQWRPVYPGLLMARFFRELGVAVTGPVETGPGPFGGTHAPDNPAGTDTLKTADGSEFSGRGRLETLTWYSPWPLDQVVKKMLAFSSNFIANQVMLTLGARVYGPPATLEKGVAVLRKFAAQQVGWENVQLAEGSGLSRKNRVTPAQMGKLLLVFMPHHTLLKTTGTQYYKTGTLTGINTRAGYFVGTDHRLYPFVIMR